MRAIYYQIDGDNNLFSTLRNAKDHIHFAYTDNEKLRYFGKEICYISGVGRDGESVSLTEIKVDENGRESYGRTFKTR